MNSTVILRNLDSQAQRTVTLAYPDELDLAANSISVFEPLGVALLGRAVGDMIECPAERCQQQFHVADVVRQPERVGAWHL
jgi:regulator of nucleoside diphosphate kinase